MVSRGLLGSINKNKQIYKKVLEDRTQVLWNTEVREKLTEVGMDGKVDLQIENMGEGIFGKWLSHD